MGGLDRSVAFTAFPPVFRASILVQPLGKDSAAVYTGNLADDFADWQPLCHSLAADKIGLEQLSLVQFVSDLLAFERSRGFSIYCDEVTRVGHLNSGP